MDYKKLGRKIKICRIERSWTQEQLAQKACISTSFLGHIERGSRIASLETFSNIATALNINADYLLADSLATNRHCFEKERDSIHSLICNAIELIERILQYDDRLTN